MGKHKRGQWALLGVLALLWAMQSAVMVSQGNWGWRTLLHTWQQPLPWRSARFYRGPAFAEEVALLRAHIPAEGRVVLPPPGTAPGVDSEREMEWFLFPRHVTNCLSTACLKQWIARGNAFVVWAPGTFRPADVPQARWLPLRGDLGVVAPAGGTPPPSPDAPLSPLRWLLEGLGEMALLGLMAWGGLGLVSLSGGSRLSGGERWAVAWVAGSGTLTFGVYILLLVGVPFKTAVGVTGAGMLAVGAWRRQRSGRQKSSATKEPRPRAAWGGLALLAGWLGLLAVLAVGKGYHATDALGIWGIKGYGIAQWGLRQGTYLGFVRDYPLHVPLLIALPKALWGDLTGMSKVVFPAFLAALAVILYEETYRHTQSALWAFLGGALWSTAPLVVQHAQIAYANLAAACYLFLGVWLWHEKGEGWLGGLMLAWGVWSRPEAWLLVGAVLAIGALRAASRRVFWQAALPPTLMTALWLLTRRMAYAYRHAPGTLKIFLPGVAALFRGKIHPAALAAVIGAWARFTSLRLWGVVGALALLGLLVMIGRHLFANPQPHSDRPCGVMALTAVGMAAVVSGIYYFTAYLPGYDIRWWINTGFDRLNLPALALLWYAVWVGAFTKTRPPSRLSGEAQAQN